MFFVWIFGQRLVRRFYFGVHGMKQHGDVLQDEYDAT